MIDVAVGVDYGYETNIVIIKECLNFIPFVVMVHSWIYNDAYIVFLNDVGVFHKGVEGELVNFHGKKNPAPLGAG